LEAALEGRKVSLPMIKEFIKRHKRLYGAAVRNFKGFRRVLGGMEYPYSEAYNFLSRVRQRVDINPSELGRQLYSLFCAGEPICLSALQGAPKGSRRRNYSNQICTLAKTDFIGGTGSPTKVISKLTGLSAASIKASIADTKKNSVLAERLVSLVFHWAPLLGIGIGVSGEVYDDSKMRRFEYDGETGYSDLRLGNNAVEVKSYSGELKGGRLEDLIAKYSPTCFNFWDDGEPMERSLVVFYQSDETYARARQRIEDAEIEVMSYKDFYRRERNH